MDSGLLKSFILNKNVFVLLISACFIVTALDLFLDSFQSKFINFSVQQIAKNNILLISQLAEPNVSSSEFIKTVNAKLKANGSPISIQLMTADSVKTDFQHEAYQTLIKNPHEPVYTIEQTDTQSIFHYVVNHPVLGILELDFQMDELEAIDSEESTKMLWVLATLGLVSTVSLAIFLGYMRRSAEVLLETQQKDLDHQKQLTYAYGRFFPHQFLDLLNKNSVLDIKLGDQSERQMAVLFSDIRNFTSAIERKTPAESFQYINDYLRDVGPIVRKNKGFIDKYIGDAIMALFENTDDALVATLNILELINRTAALAPDKTKVVTEIGAGLHFGHLMVGTVGEVERMDGTVISDVVNTSSRLESLNKAYGTHVIISEQFLNSLTFKERFKIRFIDYIFAKGKREGIKIYEIFNMDSSSIIQKKEQILPEYNRAIQFYQNRNFQEALGLFQNCHTMYAEDIVTSLFIKRCETFIAEPPPETWTPISKLASKDEI